jgi:arginase
MNVLEALYITVPEWQGSGKTNELYHGAQLLRTIACSACSLQPSFYEIEVDRYLCSEVENGILGYKQILKQMKVTRKLLQKRPSSRIFTAGGSCGSDIIPISFLNSIHDHFALLWFDAHADLNTPLSSHSKHFHGMPLRTLLGEGDSAICNLLFSTLKPSQVFLIGTRDIDPAEKKFICSQNVFNVSFDKIENLFFTLKALAIKNIYVRIDLDVLDPQLFPWVKCPTKGGVSIDDLCRVVRDLHLSFNQVGMGIMEFVPKGNDGLLEIAKILKSTLFF